MIEQTREQTSELTREQTTNMTLPGRFFKPYVPETEPIASYLERVDLFLKVSGVKTK